MELTNEDKIILAEWYAGQEITLEEVQYSLEVKSLDGKLTFFGDFNPESDSNILDLLEEKMIRELNIISIEFNKVSKEWVAYYIFIDGKGYSKSVMSIGGTIPEARLSAILSHAKTKLKEG